MFSRSSLCAALALPLMLAACGRDAPRSPHVLLVVVDTLRADKLGAYGNGEQLTPFLDSLAQRGAVFERAYATSSWTVPSMASLFTSRYPSQHHVVAFGQRLRDDEVTFGERLSAAGWLAGGFVANPNLEAQFGHSRGFADWWDDIPAEGKLRGDALRAAALDWLDGAWQPTDPRPVLLFLHYMGPHEPYDPPEEFRRRILPPDAESTDAATALAEGIALAAADSELRENGEPLSFGPALNAIRAGQIQVRPRHVAALEGLYDAEVAAADDQVRLLVEELDRRRFLEHAVVLVMADHGEAFFEHGRNSHGDTLYEELVHVPLIVLGPGVAAGTRVPDVVSLIDVAPTLLDLLALPPEPRFEGRSLAPLIRSGTRAAPEPVRDVVLQLDRVLPGVWDTRVHRRGLVRGEQKALEGRDGDVETYDLATDPGETRPEPPEAAGHPSPLVQALEQADAGLARSAAAPVPKVPIDEELRERLRAVGYLQ